MIVSDWLRPTQAEDLKGGDLFFLPNSDPGVPPDLYLKADGNSLAKLTKGGVPELYTGRITSAALVVDAVLDPDVDTMQLRTMRAGDLVSHDGGWTLCVSRAHMYNDQNIGPILINTLDGQFRDWYLAPATCFQAWRIALRQPSFVEEVLAHYP